MIFVNFFALASLIVQVFSLQLYLYFVPRQEGMVAARIYFGMFALAYGALGLMLALGLGYRWKSLAVERRRAGLRMLFGNVGTVLGAIIGNAVSTSDATNVLVSVSGRSETVATLPATIFFGIAIGWFAGSVAGRIAPKLLVKASAASTA